MLLHDRSVAINIAVLCFFALSIIGWMTGHSLFICCKRALIGAIITYVTVSYTHLTLPTSDLV